MGRASLLSLVVALVGCGRAPIIFADGDDTDGEGTTTGASMTTAPPPATTAPPPATTTPPNPTGGITVGTSDTFPGTGDDFGTTFSDPDSSGVDSFTSDAGEDSTTTSATSSATSLTTSDTGMATGGCNDVEGTWADCIDGEDCNSPVSTCAETGTPGEATCVFECDTVCDCPAAPVTGNATLGCEDIYLGDGISDCFLSCESGEQCPDGQVCFADAICIYSDDAPNLVEPYAGCNPPDFECPDDFTCVNDGMGNSTCLSGCVDVMDCVDGPPGTTVVCSDITGDLLNDCHLSCAEPGEVCPGEWFCFAGFVCLQPSPPSPP